MFACIRSLGSLDYVAFTVVIDKQELLQRYKVWRYHPYHYCLEVLIERYVRWLEYLCETGDVMAEARGKKEDRQLQEEYTRLYTHGTAYVPQGTTQAHLTSKELKVKPKHNNIAGLQLADLLAHPSYRFLRTRNDRLLTPANFGGQIASILERDKYYRSPSGGISGWGIKWLP